MSITYIDGREINATRVIKGKDGVSMKVADLSATQIDTFTTTHYCELAALSLNT